MKSRAQQDPRSGYHRSLLDLEPHTTDKMHRQHPPPTKVLMLWEVFLSNVHPLVKIFFDWDIKRHIQHAADDSGTLTKGQHALCWAIYFIAVLSLSDQECTIKLDQTSRTALLRDFQSNVETALQAANYASTSDMLVLQGFTLYIVRHLFARSQGKC